VEVSRYEPMLALDGGEDGMMPYRRILGQLEEFDMRPSLAAFECGLGQAQELARMLEEAGRWTEVTIMKDFAGIDRHVFAVRRQRIDS